MDDANPRFRLVRLYDYGQSGGFSDLNLSVSLMLEV